MTKTNLNELVPENEWSETNEIRDNSVCSADGSLDVYFRNLEERLLEHIKAADGIFGCVAWLTNARILAALRGKDVALVVQKEDFLRPDFGQRENWKTELRAAYDALHCSVTRFDFRNIVSRLSFGGDESIQPVRCMGNHNRERKPAFPRMHNKFIIFAKIKRARERYSWETYIEPYAVWTGSYNFTANAGFSLENALYITSPEIVRAYYAEFAQVVVFSEPLDWESTWVAPEWRIGT